MTRIYVGEDTMVNVFSDAPARFGAAIKPGSVSYDVSDPSIATVDKYATNELCATVYAHVPGRTRLLANAEAGTSMVRIVMDLEVLPECLPLVVPQVTFKDPSWPKMTRRLAALYDVADGNGFADPLGRAVYVTNRRYNGGFNWMTDVEIMANAKPETAARWREHWLAGGSLKSLGKKSQDKLSRSRDSEQVKVWPPTRRAISLNGVIK